MAIRMTFSAVALSVALVITALPVRAQPPSDGHQHDQQAAPAQAAPPKGPGEMKGSMAGMRMSGMKATQARLDALVRAPRHRDHPFHAIVITCCTAS